MLDGEDLPACDRAEFCRLAFCGRLVKRYVYGLVDARCFEVFYVGLAFDPVHRFGEHMRNAFDSTILNYNTLKCAWIRSILEAGSYPLLITLNEHDTLCDVYSRAIEHDIAMQLRRAGHIAISDDHWRVCRDVTYLSSVETQCQVIALLKNMHHNG